jgi:hypothetical protein
MQGVFILAKELPFLCFYLFYQKKQIYLVTFDHVKCHFMAVGMDTSK